jgi:hypothetical protein
MVEPRYGLAPKPKLPAESSRPNTIDELAENHLPPLLTDGVQMRPYLKDYGNVTVRIASQ